MSETVLALAAEAAQYTLPHGPVLRKAQAFLVCLFAPKLPDFFVVKNRQNMWNSPVTKKEGCSMVEHSPSSHLIFEKYGWKEEKFLRG